MSKLHSTAAWQRKRAAQLAREPLCRICTRIGRITPATVADHVIPHRDNVQLFWAGELQSLCKPHHDSEKQRQEKSGATSPTIKGVDASGRPLDPAHPWNAKTG